MLEETKRVTESSQRMIIQICKNPYFKETQRSKLRAAAAKGGTDLMFLASGMLNRERNQSRYDNRSKCISWTIEWRFHSTDVALFDHGVGEDTSLCSVIENHLKPGPWIHKLKPFCDVNLYDSLKLFISKYPKLQCAKAPFKELDIKAPLRHQLANVAIVEYPVIHVYLPSQSYGFEVSRGFDYLNTTPDPIGLITSREEEIKEEDINSFEPEVIDCITQVSEDSKVERGDTKSSDTQVDPTKQRDGCC
ncbi:unnamed protein product [Eruca vesicaria subsp. sativa]|uniref:BCD1 alpha/beta domain-containing protein n=1 Tax=Eruca vesicaria subsp. sativa TaxID=29727 RepID=A0ABC8L6F2_ERUVS|nr:unnamed protein product [Eruca vesicaria subsp. sativa]